MKLRRGIGYVLGLVLLVGVFCGCDGDKAGKKTIEVSEEISSALERGEPVLLKLEDVLGKPLVGSDIAKAGENYANKAGFGLKMLSGIAAVVPGGQPVAGVLEGLGVLAGAMGIFFGRRALAAKDKALGTVLKAVNPYPDVGSVIINAAPDGKTQAIVEKSYQDNVAPFLPVAASREEVAVNK